MKKTMRKTLALLLAAVLTIGCMPILGMAAFAADEPEPDELRDAIAALVDPGNLRFYTDEAILSVADALGGGYDDPQAFLDAANSGGYAYVGGRTDEEMQASDVALRELMATGADMTERSLAYAVNNVRYNKLIHRDESKANIALRVVPVLYNGAQAESAADINTLKRGDTVTFAVELETDYFVSAAELPIVFDSTKFNLVDKDGYVYAYDGDGSNDVDNIREAVPKELIDTDCLRAKIKSNYRVECYTATSPETQYPQAYQTPEYMQQYKIMLIEISPNPCSNTVPQIFTQAYSRLCTFTLQVRDDVPFDGSVEGLVGTPADWFATNENRGNLFAVTRAAGMQADGVTSALNGSTADTAFQIFDVDAQYGQTVSTQITTVSFDASKCMHGYRVIERMEPTETENGYVKYRCSKCDAEKTEILPALSGSVLELSSHKAKAGSVVDVTVTMKNNPGIIALRFGLEFDPAVLELQEVIDGGKLGVGTITTSESPDKSPFWVLWVDALTDENYTQDGVIVTFRFLVRDDAPLGETQLKLHISDVDTFNHDLAEQPFTANDSVIRVCKKQIGDADLDGILSSMDAVVIRRYLVGSISKEEIDLENADFNEDGKVNLIDVVMILRTLVN